MTVATDLPPLPAIVDGQVAHSRRGPIRHAFRNRAYQWLVDLDSMPRLPRPLRPLATFDARDHLGGTGAGATTSIKGNVERFLLMQGIDLGADSRIVMLANARVLGYVFDPISVFWCFGADEQLRCVVAEVHNTYGERHAYVLDPDVKGRATTDKQFYVSPFNDVSGEYALRFDLSPERVGVSVGLSRGNRTMFTASFSGRPHAATIRKVVTTSLKRPVMPQKTSLLIRVHGIRLWLRRLPVVARPPHLPQEGI